MSPAETPARKPGMTSYSHDGWRFDVRDGGASDAEPVVLLHGFPERGSSWDGVASLLQAEGLRTLVPDQRGYSPGARPRTRWSYRISRLVEDVVSLIDRVGQPVHLVGHDWGAVVAWALAARRPELLRSLTAVSVPHPGAMLWAMKHGPQLARSWYIGPFGVPWLAEGIVGLRPHAFDVPLRKGGMTAADVARFHTEIVDHGALRGALGWYRALPFAPRGLASTRITVRTTYVWSDQDVALSREAAEDCGRHVEADYRFVVLEGVSHWVPRQEPELLTQAILVRIRSVR